MSTPSRDVRLVQETRAFFAGFPADVSDDEAVVVVGEQLRVEQGEAPNRELDSVILPILARLTDLARSPDPAREAAVARVVEATAEAAAAKASLDVVLAKLTEVQQIHAEYAEELAKVEREATTSPASSAPARDRVAISRAAKTNAKAKKIAYRRVVKSTAERRLRVPAGKESAACACRHDPDTLRGARPS